jgi:large-conductance mechanosensitive channel
MFKDGEIRIWSILLSLLFLTLGILDSKVLTPLNYIWIKFGDLLGRVIAPVVMGFIFFLVVTPIGLFMRILGKDILRLRLSNKKSYWIKREKNIQTMKKQY